MYALLCILTFLYKFGSIEIQLGVRIPWGLEAQNRVASQQGGHQNTNGVVCLSRDGFPVY